MSNTATMEKLPTKAEQNAKLATALLTQNKPVDNRGFKVIAESFMPEIEKSLPVHLKKNAEKYCRQMVNLFTQNPRMRECEPLTILTAVMKASELGLDLSPQLGQAWILPYNNSVKRGSGYIKVMQAQFQIGYRGALQLIQRSNKIYHFAPRMVYENDEFYFCYGRSSDLVHRPARGDRGKPIYAYAVANFDNGGFDFECWSIEDIIKHAETKSPSYWDDRAKGIVNKRSPWYTDFESMALKTMVLAIWKRLPLETELQRAFAADNTITSDADALSNMTENENIFDVKAEDIQVLDEPELPETTPTTNVNDKVKNAMKESVVA